MNHHLIRIFLVMACTAIAVCSVSAQETGLRKLGAVSFLEGPAWHTDGSVFFTDIPNNKIMRRNPNGKIEVHRTPSGHANGLAFDQEGRLVIAEDDGRLVRENTDGSIEILAATFNEKPFNSLNDLDIDTRGRIYFTDPANNNRENAPQRDNNGDVVDGVYLYEENGNVSLILSKEIERPNGILISPNDEYLYVADNNGQAADGARKIWRFDLKDSGQVDVATKALIYDWGTDRGPDGMAIDIEGNLYVAAGLNTPLPHKTSLVHKAGIYVITPAGKILDFIALPIDTVSNVTFGGPEHKTLYITGGHNLWSYKVDTAGYQPF